MYRCGGLFIYRTVHVKRVGKSYAEQKLVEEQQFLMHCFHIVVLQTDNCQHQNNYYYQQGAHWMFRSSAQESVVLW